MFDCVISTSFVYGYGLLEKISIQFFPSSVRQSLHCLHSSGIKFGSSIDIGSIFTTAFVDSTLGDSFDCWSKVDGNFISVLTTNRGSSCTPCVRVSVNGVVESEVCSLMGLLRNQIHFLLVQPDCVTRKTVPSYRIETTSTTTVDWVWLTLVSNNIIAAFSRIASWSFGFFLKVFEWSNRRLLRRLWLFLFPIPVIATTVENFQTDTTLTGNGVNFRSTFNSSMTTDLIMGILNKIGGNFHFEYSYKF